MPDIFISKDSKKRLQTQPKDKQPRFKNPQFSHKSSKSLFTASIHSRTKSPQSSGSLNKKPVSEKHLKFAKKSTGALKYPNTHAERNKLPGHTHNPLASFGYFPDHVKFVNQDSEEKVVLVLRKHPITNLSWILLAALLLLAPSFLSVLEFVEILPAQFQIVLFVVWYLFTSAFIFEKFLSWFFHVNIVTDERIIEVDFLHLIRREITDANIDQIQDVTVQITGAARTYFNFGDVVIQTAAAVPKLTFEAVPNPDRVAKIMRELRIEEEVEKLEGRVR